MDRITDAALADGVVRRPRGFDLGAAWDELQHDRAVGMRAIAVRVRVRRRILPRVLRMHGDGGATEAEPAGAPDDWVDLELRFPVIDAAQALLAHGADVEVLHPSALRLMLHARAAEVATLYASEGGDA